MGLVNRDGGSNQQWSRGKAMNPKFVVGSLFLLCNVWGCLTEAEDPLDGISTVKESLTVDAEERTSTGSSLTLAEAQQLMAAAAATPVPEVPAPAALLAAIPSLSGVERREAINDYISYTHSLPDSQRAPALRRLAALWQFGPSSGETASVAVPVPVPPSPPPPPAITSCTIRFSQSNVISNMSFYQALGFADSPWYKNHCSDLGWNFKVDESGGAIAGHYHFWADDPAVNCVAFTNTWPNGVMGKDNNTNTCTAVDPLAESRNAQPHGAGYWIRIRNVTSTDLAWRVTQIKVRGTKEARVLLDNTDGTWWEYTHLTPGTWNLLDNGHKAKTAWVMNQNPNAAQPMAFDNFVIAGPL
jgi:hypothetical protein